MKQSLILVLVLTVLLSGCSFFDNTTPNPMFLELSSPKLTFGSDLNQTHNISEVWVFQDGQILGLFPLPARVPIVSDNQSISIKIAAGVRQNGMKDSPILYPFISSIDKMIDNKPGTSVLLPLDFSYLSMGMKFPINDNFEGGHTFNIDLDQDFTTKIVSSNADSSLGSNCGLVEFPSNIGYIEVASDIDIKESSVASGSSFVEFDYKGDGEIAVGIAKINGGIFQTNYILFVPAKPTWNRIYIDLTDKLQSKDFDSYRILLSFRKPATSITATIKIDNFKHLHF